MGPLGPGASSTATAIVAVCWIAFGAVWLGGAAYNARHGPAARQRRAFLPNVLGSVVVAWVVLELVPGRWWSDLHVGGPWIRALGVALLVPATAFALWARVALGTMWSSSPTAKEGHVLRTDGPYAIARHPIYTGMLGMLAGTALVAGVGRWLPMLMVAAVVVRVKIKAEEALLTDVFGEQYRRYRERVPQLVPRLGRLLRTTAGGS
jgi:protein-S-isoprenylcysteine O-methyltransferase Ste14